MRFDEQKVRYAAPSSYRSNLITSFLYIIESWWFIRVKKCWNRADDVPKINNRAPDVIAFHAVFFVYFGSCIQTIGPTLSKIGYEKLIFRDDSQTVNFSKVEVLRIDCCAWNSTIVLSEPNDKIWSWSCRAISSINFLYNFSIS